MDLLDQDVNQDDDGGEEVTIQMVVTDMRKVWANEKASPVLLPHRMELVDFLAAEAEKQDHILAQAGQADKSEIFGAKRYELARIKFVVNSYMRARLEKIERNPADIMSRHTESIESGRPDLLDEREVTFAENLLRASRSHFQASFLNQLPPGFDQLAVPKDRSELRRCIVKVGPQGLVDLALPDMTDPNSANLLNMEPGSCHYLPFAGVAQAVEEGKLDLM